MLLYRKSLGFTLIELLIVLVIVGLAMSLISPRITKTYEKNQSQLEKEKVLFILNLAAKSAMAWQGTKVHVESASIILSPLKDNSVNRSKIFNFRFLEFEPTSFSYNSKGFTTVKELFINSSSERLLVPRSLE